MKNNLSFYMNYFKLKTSLLMVMMTLLTQHLIFSQTNDCGQAILTNAWFDKHPDLKIKLLEDPPGPPVMATFMINIKSN